MCDRYDDWVVFYEVGSKSIPYYLDLGLSLLKLGEEARVRLQDFSLEGRAKKGIRYTFRKLDKEACSFEIISPEKVPAILTELKATSDSWLIEKNTREKGFSIGFFKEDYLRQFPVGIIRKDEKIIAFSQIWVGEGKDELSIDLMRYLKGAPSGVMEYLLIHLMLWGKEEGYTWFNLLAANTFPSPTRL